MVTTQQKKFIDLLEEIFQFDQADLDFGIYRIMNQKREEVTNFLNNELVPQVKKAFDKYRNADVEAIKQQMEELEQKLNEMGVAKDSSEKYLTLNERLNKGVDITALENEVFSDLTNFFRRYYHEGDFLSLRRYKKDVYAIPYEGEEVKLHWANSDQYYVKTSEYFHNYTFNLPSGKTVHFKLIEANTEQNNNKALEGKERRFILFEEQPVKEENGEFYINFEYRPPENKQTQKQLNEKTIEILHSLNYHNEWIQELQILSPTEKNKKRTLLERYLNDYTARNTFDYFIHKDLEGFLRRELDFFIKNEIMHLDDLDTENEKRFEQYLSKVKVIKTIGQKIIKFLAQIENFQKRLWLKKKFVVESNYCITLDKIPEELYIEISQNKEQIKEWIRLFAIDELDSFTKSLSIEFLKENSNLLLDTKFFDDNFKEKLLSQLNNIDKDINGVLIHSENYQALSLLQDKYKGQIKCTYIDPPYNTNSTPIIYKNGYRHSSWISLMKDRLQLSKPLMNNESVLVIAIDDTELVNLMSVLRENFTNHRISPVTIVHNPKGSITKDFNRVHEYAIFITDEEEKHVINRTLEKNETPRKMRRWGENSLRTERRLSFYPIYIKDGKIVRIGEVPDDDFSPAGKNVRLDNGEIEIWPIDQNGIERRWNFGLDSIRDNLDRITIIEDNGVYDLFLSHELTVPKTVWTGGEYDAGNYGNTLLINILGKKLFDFPKSINAVKQSISLSTSKDHNDIVLDYFAGSGTTGHAVIDLNRENDSNLKYILVEMGEYFDTVTKPRVQKVIYSKDWRDGKPVSREGSSHMFKYIRLESYEDALNNIRLSRSPQQQAALEESMSIEAQEEYLLSYMLDVEAEGSPSLLNIEAFNNPFEYKMMVTEGTETKPTKVDLVETFNYLIGLNVKTIDTIKGVKVITGSLQNGEEVLILWRKTDEVTNERLEDFFKKQGYNSRDNEFNRIYVNGDNHLENLKLAEDKWKVVLIEEEFNRLMFAEYDV
ncbi:site-specific DNA-methyltransferase [Sediminibacillus sp. JSM 1682029]|uniref:site-specific DNA-methyltransferase n=1 Tax=Sediminibacillus sp. JSM 1682029 TaxID=3229857 RepID=UPI00352549C5